MPERELTVTHQGREYQVVLDASACYVDDSFDHAFGTEKCGHWELDWDSTDIVAVVDDEGDEIDPESVKGLTLAIQDAANDLTFED